MAKKNEDDPEWPDIEGSLHIIGLRSTNFMRLKTVDLAFCPGLNRLASRENAQGKSSIMRLINLLKGLKDSPDEPIRKGEKKSVSAIDLGEIVVKIEFKAASSPTISVFTKGGKRIEQPVRYMQTLINGETFSPRGFAFDMDNKQRGDKLRAIAGLSFDDLDAERKTIFEERTGVNHEAKTTRTRAEGLPYHAGTFKIQDDTEAIKTLKGVSDKRDGFNAELRAIDSEEALALKSVESKTAEAKAKLTKIEEIRVASVDRIAARKTRLSEIEVLIAALQREQHEATAANLRDQGWIDTAHPDLVKLGEAELAETTTAALAIKADAETRRKAVNEQLDANTFETARLALAEIQTNNTKAKENAARSAAMAEADVLDAKSEKLTERIKAIDAVKVERITEASALIGAKVPGLSIDEDGIVLMNGVPFDQGSTAERWCASVMLGIAMNPKLKVVLIEDASLLSENSFRQLYAVAVEKGVQFILEEAGAHAGDPIEGVESCVFMIEDGGVV